MHGEDKSIRLNPTIDDDHDDGHDNGKEEENNEDGSVPLFFKHMFDPYIT